MRIDKLTITGADDSVSPADLVELSAAHPFVEWGILFSQSRERTPRYPSRKWVAGLCGLAREHRMSLSAHLCGKWARDIVERGEPTILKDHADHWPLFHRVQLNVSHHHEPIGLRALEFMEKECAGGGKQFIVQTNRQYDMLFQSLIGNRWAAPLFDTSGGTGLLPARWPEPYVGVYCGYAGGLKPDNLEAQMAAIACFYDDGQAAWVDMESGVRSLDNESLDLAKVRKCLEIAAGFVGRTSEPKKG
jgi:hypothetical protein